jgi:endonuclease/exonuclease/phosphatase family metal-dependent hydrolase
MILETSAQEIKVLTYNIFHGESPVHPGTSNLREIQELIKALKPDFIALQEVDSLTGRSRRIYGKEQDFIQLFEKGTGLKGYFGKAMDYDGGGYGEGLLVKNGSSFQNQLLPNPAGGEPRAIAWITSRMKNRREITFGGTHLCHQFTSNRLAQLETILSQAEKFKNPVIWVGDLNFTPDSEEYKSIPKRWTEAGKASGNLQNTYGTAEKGGRIDYIWYDSEQFELIKYEVMQVPYSDHFPVLAVLKLKNNNP